MSSAFSIGNILNDTCDFMFGTWATDAGEAWAAARKAKKPISVFDAMKTTNPRISKGEYFFSNMWNNSIKLSSWKTDFTNFKNAGSSGIGSTFKCLGKRMPLIGAVMSVVFSAPTIYKAFKHGGVGEGVKETSKEVVRLGVTTATAAAAGAAVGSIIPGIGTLLGGIVGGIIGGIACNKVIGKTYSEKLDEQQEQQQQLAQQQMQNPFSTDNMNYPGMENMGVNPYGIFSNPFALNPFGDNPYGELPNFNYV